VTLAGHHFHIQWSHDVILWTVTLAPCASFWSAAQYLLVVWSCDFQSMLPRMKCHSPDELHYSWLRILHIPSHSFTFHMSHFTSQNTPLVLVTSGARPDVDVLQALCLGSSSTLKAMWQLNNRFSSESSVLFTDWLALCLQTRLLDISWVLNWNMRTFKNGVWLPNVKPL